MRGAVVVVALASATTVPAQELFAPGQGLEVDRSFAVLPHRERAAAVNRLLRHRLDELLPRLMREAGLDMWLVINREYAEDPVYLTLVPEPVFAARRTTMLVFFDRGPDQGVERLTVSRYALGDFYRSAWAEGGTRDEQWERLGEVIRERNPSKIGIDVSRDWAFGDGLSHGLHEQLMDVVEWPDRVVSAEDLCIRWLETRTGPELQIYPHIVKLARSVIAEAFSSRVITPGVTTTDDVAWFLRQRFADLALDVWFMPTVNLQRRGDVADSESPFLGVSGGIIQPGDVLHTDVGIHYLRMNTDTQEMAYVLLPGEADVPAGLQRAMAVGNRWQDILTDNFVAGRTGNEILAATRQQCQISRILCSIYTHPIGFHGHAAGPTIGMWDNQGPTPIRGDWKLSADTCYAIEGNVKVKVAEWDAQWVQIKLEQDAWFDGERVLYLGGRQTHWHLVR